MCHVLATVSLTIMFFFCFVFLAQLVFFKESSNFYVRRPSVTAFPRRPVSRLMSYFLALLVFAQQSFCPGAGVRRLSSVRP